MADVKQAAGGAQSGSVPTGVGDCKPVSDKIELWRKDLIDLTKRNLLLFLTDKKSARLVEITSPDLQHLVDSVVGKGVALSFAMPLHNQLTLSASMGESSAPQEPVREGDLVTNLPLVDLQHLLRRLMRSQLSSQEEQGIHTLFMAAGFLRWRENLSSGDGDDYLAPIVLIPVGLGRKSEDDPYVMQLSEEDIVVNPALVSKLKTDFGVTLPDLADDPDGGSVVAYLAGVERATKDLGWQVSQAVRLGAFTYEKFVMYNDLAEHAGDGCTQPIIRALSKVAPAYAGDDFRVPDNLDEAVDPRELFPLLDADSSQAEVLLRFRRGQDLVIQGPPGTGKSQTIANLIAQGLRDGKKILFVSEKMAALEVVSRRLNATGLSFACLEVHSHKTNQLKVVQELARTLNDARSEKAEPDLGPQYQKLIRLRDTLNGYVTELHRPRGGLGLSAFLVDGRLARILGSARLEFPLPTTSVMKLTPDRLDELRGGLQRIAQVAGAYDNLEHHPWHGVELKTSDASGPLDPSLFVDDVSLVLDSLRVAIPRVQAESASLATRLGQGPPVSVERAKSLLKAIEVLSRPRAVAGSWVRLSRPQLVSLISDTKQLRNMNELLAAKRAQLEGGFQLEVLQLPVDRMLHSFQHEYRGSLRSLNSGYRRDMGELRQHANSAGKLDYEDAKRALSLAFEVKSLQGRLTSEYAESRVALGQSYVGEATDWGSVISGLEWLLAVMDSLGQSALAEGLAEAVMRPDLLSQLVSDAGGGLGPEVSRAVDLVSKFESKVKGYSIRGKGLLQAPLPDAQSWLDAKKNPDDIRNWLSLQKARERCGALGLSPFLEAARQSRVPAGALENVFMQRIWKSWLAEAYRDAPVLGEFTSASHEQIIADFKTTDKNLRDLTAKVVRQNIARRQPKAEASAASASQMGIILREAKKKRRVMPLRKLFEQAPHLIQDLKPCMLMSPLSVASYLGKSPYHFDWVVFDEASQIAPADAIGSILRGKHLVVAGDDKQLPPTRFFQAGVDYDDDDETFEEPLESILDECLALPGFKNVFLRWHYRSKREELIDFSNKNFYEGKLVTFPSPDSRDASPAIEFRHVPDGEYDRGGTRKNAKEAAAVCDMIEDHFRQYGAGLSLGIITLGIQQEEAILDELDQRMASNPELSVQVKENEEEPFFVKSLEKVQGDERDCIMISIGYGKDKSGVLSLNFGPINKAGGERRLNVAVTRAREKLVVVSSILPQEMDLTKQSTRSVGASMLVRYLEYAYLGGRFPTQASGTGDPESDFEYDVREKLLARGFEVDAQVGCSGFRIDLAIRNPLHRDRYVLGIECDGATYHSQRSARDRDRLRQEVLEELGWRLHRIWSTDWIKNPDAIVSNIAARVSDLQERGPSEAGVLAPEPASGSYAWSEPPGPSDNGQGKEDATPQEAAKDTQYGFKEYVEYRQKGKRPDVESVAQAVVQLETPIHADALIRRIGAVYGLNKIGPKNRRIIVSHIRLAVAHKKFQVRQNFCWIGDQAPPRVPREGQSPRPVEEIALEELMEAARIIVAKQKGVPREPLVREVAKVFGFKRTGEKVELRIGQAIDLLYKKGAFSTYGDQVILSSSAA